MVAPTQDKQALQLTTTLGKDKLLAQEFSGTEYLSRPFEFYVQTEVAPNAGDVSSITGKSVTVTLIGDEGVKRTINAVAWSVSRNGDFCTIQLKPWVSYLRLSGDNRIFQEKSTSDILTTVFKDRGFTNFKFSLTKTLTARPYCVQFGESDFRFMSRLLEEEGLGYYFDHTTSDHTLVIFDDSSGCKTLTGGDIDFLPISSSSAFASDRRFQSLWSDSAVTSEGFRTSDFAFETPSTPISVTVGETKRSPYLYPGRFQSSADGQARAKKRLEALSSKGSLIRASGPFRGVMPGTLFTMKGHPTTALNQEYLATAVRHMAERGQYASEIMAQPKSIPYGPEATTTRPRMAGPQTAIVVGKSGEEIWTDKYGRIKVQFHWDREGKKDESSSCWLRVSQSWAGSGWGAFFLPRIGQEVLVSFIDGDPDRPIVTGCVYNGEMSPPYALTANQTKSTIKSNTSKGGKGSNELRFEDKKDSEEIYVHAQKDMNTVVENDLTSKVLNDETHTITNNRTITVEKGNEIHKVAGTRTMEVTKDETHKNAANVKHQIKGNATFEVDGNVTIEAKGKIEISADGNISIEAGGSMTLKSGGSMSIQSGSSLTQKSSTAMTVQGGTATTVKAGTGMTVQGGTTVTVKGSASGTVDGGGMLTLKGGLVKAN